ncbi:hypothetical protein LOAG_13775 [Loa loa]|uniref:Uncharacterized protein n=1 Tax=Loa loa TaxID=7209 RepID=A0A1S0TK96_LOALO|nr:hypothetical protein LOAG_13775 [Loa loa]EFO14741.1 hypothetical protein LOAG_13775 [Loa loa]
MKEEHNILDCKKKREEAIIIETKVVGDLTNELQMVELPELPTTNENNGFHDLNEYRTQPDILNGADYFD